MAIPLYPYCFTHIYKDYLWGGDRIIRLYHRHEPPGVYAESWEVSDRLDGMSLVRNGPLAGKSLRDVVQASPEDVMGRRVRSRAFPLLIKLIDSRERLSVQVHPNDQAAKQYGGEAKTEMWYVLDADPGAGVFAGLKPGVDEKALNEALRTKRFKDILNFIPVSPGDAIFVPGGRVHAIDAGCLLLEVQQNSNTTYRLYDWDRVGPDGKARPLHLREAMRVIQWNDPSHAKVPPRKLEQTDSLVHWEILRSPYFHIERLQMRGPWSCDGNGQTFQVFFAAAGAARVEWEGEPVSLKAGTSCLVPALLAPCRLVPGEGGADVVRITVP